MNPTEVQQWLTEPNGMTDRLRALRAQAGLTGVELAERTDLTQSKISKLENGRQTPSVADIEAWAEACEQPDAAEGLKQILDHVSAVHRDWKRRLSTGGHANVQKTFVELTENTTAFRSLDLTIVPGMLQTPRYAKAIFVEMAEIHEIDEDPDVVVAGRMQRQQFLYDTSKQFEFIVHEAALRRVVDTIDAMRGQLDRIRIVLDLPNVRLGVLPLNARLKTTPQNAFALFDNTALVETFVGETSHEGSDAEKYHRIMNRLWDDAVTGDAAQQIIVGAIEALESR